MFSFDLQQLTTIGSYNSKSKISQRTRQQTKADEAEMISHIMQQRPDKEEGGVEEDLDGESVPLHQVTDDIWIHICDFLPPKELVHLSLTSQHFHGIVFNRANHYYIWRRLIGHVRGDFVREMNPATHRQQPQQQPQPQPTHKEDSTATATAAEVKEKKDDGRSKMTLSESKVKQTRRNYCSTCDQSLFETVRHLTLRWDRKLNQEQQRQQTNDEQTFSCFNYNGNYSSISDHPYRMIQDLYREHTLHFDSSTMEHNRDTMTNLMVSSMYNRYMNNEYGVCVPVAPSTSAPDCDDDDDGDETVEKTKTKRMRRNKSEFNHNYNSAVDTDTDIDSNTDRYRSLCFAAMNVRQIKNSFDSLRSKWETVHANIQCTSGHIYEWSIKLDRYNPNQNSNFWVVILGIQDDNLQFQRHNSQVFGDWLARTGNGLGYILHCREWISNNMSYSRPKLKTTCVVQTGDIISFRLNMVHSCEGHDTMIRELSNRHNKSKLLDGASATTIDHSSTTINTFHDMQSIVKQYMHTERQGETLGASLEMFFNGEAVLDEPIVGIMGQQLWPTVSIIDQQQVSIWPGILVPSDVKVLCNNGHGNSGSSREAGKSSREEDKGEDGVRRLPDENGIGRSMHSQHEQRESH